MAVREDQRRAAVPLVSRARGVPAHTATVIVILIATALRIALAPFGRYYEDNVVLAFRAKRLAEVPIRSIYATNQGTIDHLPGDLWFLWYVSNFYHALTPNSDYRSHAFLIATKLVPILTDVGAAFALYLLARDLAGPKAGLLAATLYAFNPGAIFIASIWDQWDSISACAVLFSIWFFLRGRLVVSAAVLTYAAMIKPQFAALGLIFALAYLHRTILPAWREARLAGDMGQRARVLTLPIARAVAAVAVAYATATAVLVPFGVGLPPFPTQFNLRDRLHFVYLVHDETTLNAFTLWATPIAGNGVNDFQLHFLGLTTGTWGRILLAAALLYILASLWRQGATDLAVVWASLATTFCLFMLPTRIHERYLLLTVALAALVVAIQPRHFWFFAIITVTFTANVAAVFWMAHASTGAPFFSRYNPLVMLGSIVNVALLVWVLARALPRAGAVEPGPVRRSDIRQRVRAAAKR